MDKNAIYEFLNQFLGCARPPLAKMDWNLAQLKYASVYFGMSAEDGALRQHFKRRIHQGRVGTFVDIGASMPSTISNTYLFYLLGWRGLAFDPNPKAAEAWRTVRPLDKFIQAAVGEEETTAYWFRHAEQAGMSTVLNSPQKPEGAYEGGVSVEVVRLDRIFEQHFNGQSIQLMSLDIEGGELSALRSNNWLKWRPEVIVMEAHGFDMMNPTALPSVAFLLQQGYALDAKLGENVFMVDKSVDARPVT